MREVHEVGKFVEKKSDHKQEGNKALDCVVAASLSTAGVSIKIPNREGLSLVDHN